MATLKAQGSLVHFDPRVIERVEVSLRFGKDRHIDIVVMEGTDTPILSLELSYTELMVLYEQAKQKFAGILT